jgi:hypothetical protein
MRDFRDAKVMAHALRDALKAKAFEITHSESLELIAKAFGLANWNILSAKIEVAGPRADDERRPSPVGAQEPAQPKTLHCSFCGKSQHDVKKLISGPSVRQGPDRAKAKPGLSDGARAERGPPCRRWAKARDGGSIHLRRVR